MLDYQKEILEKKLPYLLGELVLDSDFFGHVISRELLPEGAIEDIQAKTTAKSKIFRFVELLKKRPPARFNQFLTILKLTQQDHIFKELNIMRHQKIKHLPKSPDIEKNVKRKLQSELIPGRLLSTADKDILCQHFVLRADYDEINEDKHILQQDKEKIQKEVEDEREKAEYEMRHHEVATQELKTEKAKYNNLQHEYEALKNKLVQMVQNMRDLREANDKFKAKMREQEEEILQLRNTLEECNKNHMKLQQQMDYENRTKEINTKKLERTESETSTRFEQITVVCVETDRTGTDTDNSVPKSPQLVKDLEIQLKDLSNGVNKVYHGIHDENDRVGEAEHMNTDTIHKNGDNGGGNATTQSSVVRSERKHHRQVRQARENNRVINLETEISVLKSKLKRFEEAMEEHNGILKHKDKQLKEGDHQIMQLRQKLRLQRENSAVDRQPCILVPHPPNYTNTTVTDLGYPTQRSLSKKLSGNLRLRNKHENPMETVVFGRKTTAFPTLTTISYEKADSKGEKSPSVMSQQSVISLDIETSCLTTLPKRKSANRN